MPTRTQSPEPLGATMRTLLYCIILLLCYFNGICQAGNASGFDTLSFINQFVKDKRPHIFLYRDIHPHTIAEIRAEIVKAKFVRRIQDENENSLSDSIILTKPEVNELLQQLEVLQKFHWNKRAAASLNLDVLKLIGSDTAFNQFEGLIRYQIVPPLLFRNGEYCFLYFDYNCGPLCGQGQLVIYKKEKEGWKRGWTLFGWNS